MGDVIVEALPTASTLGVPELVHLGSIGSTMDEAHERARAGAADGLLIVADRQTAGRGRSGNRWTSDAGAGLWMTLVLRRVSPASVRVLSLRTGLAVADAVQPFCTGRVGVKWPNDLYTTRGKLGGILIEARWRDSVIEWVAVGIGINLRVPPEVPRTDALRVGTTRAELLTAMLPSLRSAAQGDAMLGADERDAWRARDIAFGRRIVGPVAGVVCGVADDGALLVTADEQSSPTPIHAGSIVFADDRLAAV